MAIRINVAVIGLIHLKVETVASKHTNYQHGRRTDPELIRALRLRKYQPIAIGSVALLHRLGLLCKHGEGKLTRRSLLA